MPFGISNTNEPRSIRAAQLHGRIGFACTEILVSLVLIVSICAIVLMLGTNAASASVRNLVMVDDGISGAAIFAVIGAAVLFLLLAPFAFNGLTPGHVRRRRSRR
jgi:hypothetical protein